MTPGLATAAAVVLAAASAAVLTGGSTAPSRVARMARARDPGVRTARSASPGAGGQRARPTARMPHAAAGSSRAENASVPAGQRLVVALIGGVGLALVVGGPVGVFLGVVAAAVGFVVLGNLEPRAARERRERVARDLPAAVSLLASAVAAGATPVAAVEVVAAAVGGPLSADLSRLAAIARLGGDFAPAGEGSDTQPARVARVLTRAIDTGAPLAQALDRLAADLQAERRFEIDRRARAVGVRAAAPLGVCFLPGFLLVGVVPVVAGIAATVLGPL